MNLTLFADQILSERDRKTLAILEAIRKGGSVSRVHISKVTEQNLVTVSKYVSDLVNRGFVLEKGLDVSTGGRRPALVELNATSCCGVGVLVHPQRTLGVLLDLKSQIIARTQHPGVVVSSEKDLEFLPRIVGELVQQARVDSQNIKGVGVSLSQIMTAGKRMAYHDLLHRVLQKPVSVERDLILSSLAEQWLSTDRSFRNVLYLYGITGACVVVNGRVYRGAGQLAGNLSPIPKDDLTRVEQLLKASQVNDGDIQWLAGLLGKALVPLANLLAPDAIVLGGGFDRLGSSLLDRLTAIIKEQAIEEVGAQLSIVPARLGDEAAAIGAAGTQLVSAFLTNA